MSVSDEGLLRGDGAFEFLRVYSGHPFALAEHLARLDDLCDPRLDCDREQIERDIDAVVGALGPQRLPPACGTHPRRLARRPCPARHRPCRTTFGSPCVCRHPTTHPWRGEDPLLRGQCWPSDLPWNAALMKRCSSPRRAASSKSCSDRILLLCRFGWHPLHASARRVDIPGLDHAANLVATAGGRRAARLARGGARLPRGVCGQYGTRGPGGRFDRNPHVDNVPGSSDMLGTGCPQR